MDAYRNGLSGIEVGRRHGFTHNVVYWVLKKHGIECRRRRRFTDDELAAIRAERDATGHSYRRIAARWGVSDVTIFKICTRDDY